MKHLAIMDKHTIDMILNGEKTIESRFSKYKISPFNKVKVNDKIYLKESGKKIVASFEVAGVIYFDNLNPKKIIKIKRDYNNLIKAPDIYWNKKLKSNYGTLIYIKNAKKIKPIIINKKGRQGFVSFN